jgi:hypothetical protein
MTMMNAKKGNDGGTKRRKRISNMTRSEYTSKMTTMTRWTD